MTRLELEVGDLVLRGLPASYGEGFGPLVEQRIGELARGAEAEPGEGPEAILADRVARQVWDQVRPAVADVWGERR